MKWKLPFQLFRSPIQQGMARLISELLFISNLFMAKTRLMHVSASIDFN